MLIFPTGGAAASALVRIELPVGQEGSGISGALHFRSALWNASVSYDTPANAPLARPLLQDSRAETAIFRIVGGNELGLFAITPESGVVSTTVAVGKSASSKVHRLQIEATRRDQSAPARCLVLIRTRQRRYPDARFVRRFYQLTAGSGSDGVIGRLEVQASPRKLKMTNTVHEYFPFRLRKHDVF